MKKLIYVLFAILIVSLSVVFIGCNPDDNDDKETGKEFVILYADQNGSHSIFVRFGEVYSIYTPLPEKEGHVFVGLFDSEVGGVQYVSSQGVCLSPFKDRENIVLFAQFAPLTYTVKLNYGEGERGQESITVIGDTFNPPADVSVLNKDYLIFDGWYTERNCSGEKIANSNGELLVSNEYIAIMSASGDFTIYAGFKLRECEVIFYSDDGSDILHSEAVLYGTLLQDITYVNDIKYGNLYVKYWSLTPNGNIFDGEITNDISFYAASYKLSVPLYKQNCNNDYDTAYPSGDSYDRGHHNGYELVVLSFENVTSDSGVKGISFKGQPQIYFEVLQDIRNLPITGTEKAKELNNDSFKGRVKDTNINGRQIGLGAFQFTAYYSDGSSSQTVQTDFLNGSRVGSTIDLACFFESGKTAVKIDVTVVYEMHVGAPGFLGIWWHRYTNWRLSQTVTIK